jgi:hypothetical protein
MAILLGFVSTGSIAALDLPTSIQTVAMSLFDVEFQFGRRADVPTTAALVSIAAHVIAATVIVWWSVTRAQRTGVGGAS